MRSGDRTRDLLHQGRALTNCATLAPPLVDILQVILFLTLNFNQTRSFCFNLQYLTYLVGTLSKWSRIIVLQDRSLYHIPLPPIQCCVEIFLATASSCENQQWIRGQTGMGVPANVTSIVGQFGAGTKHRSQVIVIQKQP